MATPSEPQGDAPRRDFMGNVISPRLLANLAEWAAWDGDGRTPSWLELNRTGLLAAHPITPPPPTPAEQAALNAMARAEARRWLRRQLLADPTPVTRGQLRRLVRKLRRQFARDVADVLTSPRGGRR